jgi:uncharacterized metal-binding protein YceD (DUF177 family)
LGKFTAYKVELASLADGHYEQEFEIGKKLFEDMENTDILDANVHVHLDLDKRNEAYDCKFKLKGEIQIPCDRCLDPLTYEIDTEYHVVVTYGDSYDDGADNLLVIPYSNSYINVAYMLYDTILLEIPLRHVHPLGKCNRAMADVLRKHKRANDEEMEEALDDVDAEIENDD